MTPTFDLLTMGRSSIDLYSNDVGAAFVEIKSFPAYVGGSPTNIAVGAQRLNAKTALLTAVGADPVGDFILHFLNQEESRLVLSRANLALAAVPRYWASNRRINFRLSFIATMRPI